MGGRELKIRVSIDTLLFWSVALFCTYSLWYHYVFSPIGSIMLISGGLMAVALVVSLMKKRKITGVSYVLIFAIYSIIISFLFNDYNVLTYNAAMNILKSILPMLCVYCYIGNDGNKMKKIMVLIAIIITLLSISLFLFGTINDTGALVLENLNANVFSCFILLGLIAEVYLLHEVNGSIKIILLIMIAIGFVAQIMAYSRRGILVYVFFVLTYLHSYVSINQKGKILSRLIIIMLVLVMAFYVLLNFESLIGNLTIFQNMGQTGSDIARAYYQLVAWNIFIENPILGGGLNAVASQIEMYSHSLYYELLACTGIIGTILFLLPLIRLIVKLLKTSSNKKLGANDRIKSRTIMWGAICMLISGVAVVYIYDVHCYILIAILESYQNVIKRIEGVNKG